jgi:phosphoribosyl-AMP cyclohydrolase / phosphoribosyl-ATP pyrophosphohydrolase
MQLETEDNKLKGMFTVTNLEVIGTLKFDAHGLIPAIVQDTKTNKVLMLAYMNKEALEKTLTGGKACYFSRSRQELWLKGETSGHFQYVQQIYYDCDADSLLLMVEQEGPACHTNIYSCFHNKLAEDGTVVTAGEPDEIPGNNLGIVLEELFEVIKERKASRLEGAYTTYLFDKGQDKILKKVGEETAECIIASKNNNQDEISYEVSDLFYHLMVLLSYHDMEPSLIADELDKRRKK